jgi:hypothetical protein
LAQFIWAGVEAVRAGVGWAFFSLSRSRTSGEWLLIQALIFLPSFMSISFLSFVVLLPGMNESGNIMKTVRFDI